VGADRLCLRLPTVVMHVIEDGSPLAHWADPSGILLDADSEIVVVVSPPPQPLLERTKQVATDDSLLAHWTGPSGILLDADPEIADPEIADPEWWW